MKSSNGKWYKISKMLNCEFNAIHYMIETNAKINWINFTVETVLSNFQKLMDFFSAQIKKVYYFKLIHAYKKLHA